MSIRNKKLNKTLHRDSITKEETFSMLLLILVSAIVPLIVYMKPIELKGIRLETWTGAQSLADFFSYYKSELLVICLIFFCVVWLYRIMIKRDISFNAMYIPIIVYVVMVTASTLLAHYKDVAFSGYVDRYEGFYVLIAYVFILLTAMSCTHEKTIKNVLIAIFISCTIIAILGLTQFYGIDFLQTSLGKKLILPKVYEGMADTLTFNFGRGIMYTTVYNPNYLGSYSALLLPVSISLYYLWSQKYGLKMALGLLFTSASFILFLGGMSRAGLLGGALAILLFIVLFRKEIMKRIFPTILLGAMLLGIYLVMDLTSSGSITQEAKNTLPSSIEQPSDITNSTQKEIEHFTIQNNTVELATGTEGVRITYLENEGLVIEDLNQKALNVIENEGIYSFEDKKYEFYQISLHKNGFYISWNGISIPFTYAKGKLNLHYKSDMLVNEFEKPEAIGFKGYERFASNRGYIWSRSIPLLRNTIFLGNGPDTFAIYFPQLEVDAKINYFNNPSIIVDKPHSWYLQMGINTGIISLIAMLVFLAWYWFKGFRIWIKDVDGTEKTLGAAILCGVTGYCVAGIFNDSTVSVAPVFWVLLGIGVALVNKCSAIKEY